MNKETAEALEATIAKWDEKSRVRNQADYLVGVYDCPLCALFRPTCSGCPVMTKTGMRDCDGTPCVDAIIAREEWGCVPDHPAARQRAHRAAREERDFLISLRRKE